jgi:RNA polymerase sigma factor (sigma-70 family)
VAILDKEADRLRIAEILRRLDSDASPQAWAEFLEVYSALLFQVVRMFEADPDDVSGCFVFVCEQLSRDRFHRLRKFRPGGPASFPTWIRAVTRRLCVDWYRSQSGRVQVFDSIAGLSALDQEVFRRVHQDGASLDEALLELGARFNALTGEQVSQSVERIQRALTSRQRWLLSTRKRQFEPLEAALLDDTHASLDRLQDPAPGPEDIAVERQRRAGVARALARLPSTDRFMLRLRFEQDLTLDQVARLSGLPDAQTADRRLRKILDVLRQQIGKPKAASV